MNLTFTGLNIDVTDALKEYVSGKLERVTRHIDNVISVAITLSVEKLEKKAEVNLHVAGKDLHVEAHNADMYAAIDALMDKLDRAVIKYKEKNNQHRSTVSPVAEE
ncbi:ribosome hibernation-promoting factor, HPF/YfiA family [Stenoxybacter acetivorans]|uniref:ribosome hibernation-promoting factor, HPF/YfiA family n=1 Tax=Stenoxybacter acetivorans TaxID=422441 RepID=UPI00055A15C1|nr:ribosome-associated translation inhibitor RaiA [Stenoxybacter acetivorans]